MAPTLRAEDEGELIRGLEILKAENIWFDLAAVPFNVYPEPYPYETGRRYVRLAKDIAGFQKLIWGTDVPSVLFRGSYQELLHYLTESGIFTDAELDAVLYGNALDAYQWKK